MFTAGTNRLDYHGIFYGTFEDHLFVISKVLVIFKLVFHHWKLIMDSYNVHRALADHNKMSDGMGAGGNKGIRCAHKEI